jgi:D-alanine-D-alanine ligase-like ATP-grasp enzyme
MSAPLPDIDWVFILEPTCPAIDQFISQPAQSGQLPSPLSPVNHAVALSNEFGKSSSSQDLLQLIANESDKIHVSVHKITLQNYRQLLDEFDRQSDNDRSRYVVVNLCDGCETDGYPGVSIIKEMEKRGVAFTGSDSAFYDGTTSKPAMKRVLLANNVPTSPFLELTEQTSETEIDAIAKYPLFVKPSVSYASIAITGKSVVFDARQALEQARQVQGVGSGVFVERFLAGREFTALVTGSTETGVRVYPVAERVFNPQLQRYQRILAFDSYWDGYDLQGK